MFAAGSKKEDAIHTDHLTQMVWNDWSRPWTRRYLNKVVEIINRVKCNANKLV